MRECLAGLQTPVVLDLGSNIGTFSLYVFQHFPQAQVHAYEAGADTFRVLSETRQCNAELNRQVQHAAVWHEDGVVSLELTALSTGSRVSRAGQVPAHSLAHVLDRMPAGQVNLAKIDIEGAEAAVLADRNELLARIENLIVELHPGRCGTGNVTQTLRAVYPYVQAISGRKSSKPLLLASHQRYSTLPLYLA